MRLPSLSSLPFLRAERFVTILAMATLGLAGVYVEQFRRWFSVFPREHFFVESLEAFRQNPVAVYTQVCSFLGVDAIGSASFPTDTALESQLARRYNEGLNQVRRLALGAARGCSRPRELPRPMHNHLTAFPNLHPRTRSRFPKGPWRCCGRSTRRTTSGSLRCSGGVSTGSEAPRTCVCVGARALFRCSRRPARVLFWRWGCRSEVAPRPAHNRPDAALYKNKSHANRTTGSCPEP